MCCWAVQKRNAGYPGSSMICLSKMAARGTGFPPLYTMGFWDKEHHMRLFVKCNLTCPGVFMKALLLVYNILIRCCIRLWNHHFWNRDIQGWVLRDLISLNLDLNSDIFHLRCCFTFLFTFEGQPIKLIQRCVFLV